MTDLVDGDGHIVSNDISETEWCSQINRAYQEKVFWRFMLNAEGALMQYAVKVEIPERDFRAMSDEERVAMEQEIRESCIAALSRPLGEDMPDAAN
jgi:hypothetical protein